MIHGSLCSAIQFYILANVFVAVDTITVYITSVSGQCVVTLCRGQVFWRLQIPDNAEVVDSQGSGLELQLADKTTLEVR